MLTNKTNIGALFCQYFELKIANSDELKQQIYQLRYQVLCEELGHITPQTHPNRQEYDDYDNQAIHCAVIHKSSGKIAGSVRCVVPKAIPYADLSLPFENICSQQALEHMAQINRNSIIEISRINVAQYFRRAKQHCQLSTLEIQLSKQIAVILGLCTHIISKRLNRPDNYAIMEPALAYKYQALGADCQPCSEPFEFHGQRKLYHLDYRALEKNLKPSLVNMLHQVLACLTPQLAAHQQVNNGVNH